MRKICISASSLHRFDAVGNDVFLAKEQLEASGHSVSIFAEFYEPELAPLVISKSQLDEFLTNRENLIICHFSIYWAFLEEIVHVAACPIILRYHNITPPEMFLPWDEASFHGTAAAKAQVIRLVNNPKISMVLSASPFNVYELVTLVGHSNFRFTIIPPFTSFGSVGTPESQQLLDPNYINILFVGRIVPNKGHTHLLKTLRELRQVLPERHFSLHLVGKVSDQFQTYFSHLKALTSDWNLSEHVRFWGGASQETLHSLYRQSTLFLCLSDHEGFCVPIIEAQAHSLPVVTWNKGALGDTVGWGSGMVLASEWTGDIIQHIIEICDNPAKRQTIVEEGARNVVLYDNKILGRQLYQYLASV